MEKLLFLKEVAQFVGVEHIINDINSLENKYNDNCPLILPLIGDFSSGKTTLINALTDSHELETAIPPTTASIYEIHFGCPECYAIVHHSDGSETRVDDISLLKNKELKDIPVIDVFDTSTKVPSSIVLVDTPGLQSIDARHREILTDFLPQADGIFIVVDINPQLNHSLIEYVNNAMRLSQKQMFVIYTKSESKSKNEIIASKKDAVKKLSIPLNNIISVSALQNDISELLDLFHVIQEEKTQIMKRANVIRLHTITEYLIEQINHLLENSKNSLSQSEALFDVEDRINNINRNVERILHDIKDKTDDLAIKYEREFEDNVEEQLDQIVANIRGNYDNQAMAIINSSSSFAVNNLCTDILNLLRNEAIRASNKIGGLTIRCLDSIDLSNFKVEGLRYDLQLNTLGHEHDGQIATGLKIATAAAIILSTGGGGAETVLSDSTEAAGEAAPAKPGDFLSKGFVLSQVVKPKDGTNQDQLQLQKIKAQYESINQEDQQIGQQFGVKKGLVESVVGLAADYTWAKVQRQRAIHSYVDSTLVPSFKQEVKKNITALLNLICFSIRQEVSTTVEELNLTLKSLQDKKQEQIDAYNLHVEKLEQYKLQLSNIL